MNGIIQDRVSVSIVLGLTTRAIPGYGLMYVDADSALFQMVLGRCMVYMDQVQTFITVNVCDAAFIWNTAVRLSSFKKSHFKRKKKKNTVCRKTALAAPALNITKPFSIHEYKLESKFTFKKHAIGITSTTNLISDRQQ